ncbi:hypothetical protein HS088_TW16G00821 [Tripterygium wilfordii]|uniref:Uncharacterized protein n=1 Tax=Tripterygium wilfordii TaxID=458696 RepID=A0A7J7CJZ0_TRIWF|nr:hypothetical protein HS088_TW16G00821 [Tripterygium wilfordii]
MVNCDECRVWVHTRCSRYVKGEDLFTCNKFKSKSNRNDSEEIEFNFQYKEFPCWEEQAPDVKIEQENENLIDKGAGVLFSLSKESMLAAPVASVVGMRGKNKEDARDRKESTKDKKKESTLLEPSVMQSYNHVAVDNGVEEPETKLAVIECSLEGLSSDISLHNASIEAVKEEDKAVTNPSRRRRKFDAEYSEDNEYVKGRSVKELDVRGVESQRDEFPKGKQKARKQRR